MRRLTVLIALSVLLDTVFSAALAPLLPRLAAAVDLSKSNSGVLTAVFTFGALLAWLPAAVLASRIQSNGKIVAVGRAFGDTDPRFALARYLGPQTGAS